MKIVCVTQNMSVGGVQRLVVDEVNEFVRRGHDVWLVTFERAEPNFLHEVRLPEERKVYIAYPRMRDFFAFAKLVRLLLRIRADALITHMWFANTVGRMAAVCAGVPRIFAYEHSNYEGIKPNRQFFFDFILQRVSRVIAVSNSVRDALVNRGIARGRITVIPNGINLSRFRISNVNKQLFFLFIGRLVRDKGADIFLEALARIPEAKGVIAGDGPERARLEERAAGLKLAGRVDFVGSQRDVVPLYSDAYAVVMPSRREGFGLVAVEALACGIPVIATRVGGLPDIVIDRVNGLLVPADNADELAAAMMLLKEDSSLRETCARDAASSAQRFSVESHADSLERLLNGALP
jgi:glycosyltransferase involved in cell wall biosynthesis